MIKEVFESKDSLMSKYKAIAKLVEQIPIRELLEPPAKAIGEGVGSLTSLIFDPINAAATRNRQVFEEEAATEIGTRLDGYKGDLTSPPLRVSIPLLEGAILASDSTEVRRFFYNLLAASISASSEYLVHPSYANLVSELSPDEAKILRFLHFTTDRQPTVSVRRIEKYRRDGLSMGHVCSAGEGRDTVLVPYRTRSGVIRFASPNDTIEPLAFGETFLKSFGIFAWDAGCERPKLGINYIDNLCRLSIIETVGGRLACQDKYTEIINSKPFIEMLAKDLTDQNTEQATAYTARKGFIRFTSFGREFMNCCMMFDADSTRDRTASEGN